MGLGVEGTGPRKRWGAGPEHRREEREEAGGSPPSASGVRVLC